MELPISGTNLANVGKLWRTAPDKIDATVSWTRNLRCESKTEGRVFARHSAGSPFSVNICSYPVL